MTFELKYEHFTRRRYHIVFCDRLTGRWRWWDIFTRKGWRHCFIWWQPPDTDAIIQIASLFWGISLHFSQGDIDDALMMLANERVISSILVVDCDLPGPLPFVTHGPITCVTFAKATMGIRARHIWTPHQLHRYLLTQKGATSWPQQSH